MQVSFFFSWPNPEPMARRVELEPPPLEEVLRQMTQTVGRELRDIEAAGLLGVGAGAGRRNPR